MGGVGGLSIKRNFKCEGDNLIRTTEDLYKMIKVLCVKILFRDRDVVL